MKDESTKRLALELTLDGIGSVVCGRGDVIEEEAVLCADIPHSINLINVLV